MIEELERFETHLDQALDSYASTKPRAGLEQRIVARLKVHPTTENQPRRNLTLFWTIACASLVTLLALVAISLHAPHTQQKEVARQIPFVANPILEAPATKTRASEMLKNVPGKQPLRRPQQRPVLRLASLVKHGQPQLTESDRLLIQLASLDPQDALTFSQLQQSPDRPIATSPLQVHPLTLGPIVIAPIAINRNQHASF